MTVDIDQAAIDALVARPSEGLNVEIKSWIDPLEKEGEAKIAKAALALFNRNGGYILIGFNDTTLLPETEGRPADVGASFNVDAIQVIVSRYASHLFEVGVGFGNRDGQAYPVIVVPDGVQFPVAAKKSLTRDGNKTLIEKGAVYFRTLATNGVPSSAAASPNDWSTIVDICFENREADIGRFLRRHLGSDQLATIAESFGISLKSNHASVVDLKTMALDVRKDGERRREEAFSVRQFSSNEAKLVERGSWSVAVAIYPSLLDGVANRQFLNTAYGANPRLTGWPPFIDTRSFSDEADATRVVENAGQALIIFEQEDWASNVDFQVLKPEGQFYLWRIYQDDLSPKITPGALLDPTLMLVRMAETLAVCLAMTKALAFPEDSRLGVLFTWNDLRDRRLSSWADSRAFLPPSYRAYDDSVEGYVEIPLDTPLSALAPYVEKPLRVLLAAFDGFELRSEVIEEWVARLIERRLGA